MTSSIGERLRTLRLKSFETARDAAKAYGWNENTYRAHENGTRGVPREWLLTYASTFGVSLSWLTQGKEEGGKGRRSEGQAVPLLDLEDLPARRDAMHSVIRKKATKGHIILPEPIGSEDAIGIPVSDHSMVAPGGDPQSLYPGDTVIVDIRFKLTPGKVYLVYDPIEKAHAFRKGQAVTPDLWRFAALNPDHRSFELEAKSMHIIGQIRQILRVV